MLSLLPSFLLQANLDVEFYPLEMTHPPEGSAAEEKKADELGDGPKELSGSLFFALPNGQAIMYNLKGTSKPPDTEGVIEVTLAAFLLPSASHSD